MLLWRLLLLLITVTLVRLIILLVLFRGVLISSSIIIILLLLLWVRSCLWYFMLVIWLGSWSLTCLATWCTSTIVKYNGGNSYINWSLNSIWVYRRCLKSSMLLCFPITSKKKIPSLVYSTLTLITLDLFSKYLKLLSFVPQI